jgi:predicted ATPase
LLGLLWALLDGNSMLLLEKPEISLNDGIVKEIPLILERLQRDRKTKRQVLLSTHSEALLSNPGIDGLNVVLLMTGKEGTTARALDQQERGALEAGMSIAEVVLPKTRPDNAKQLGLWQ